ncbi:MAG: ATP-dependent DNA helicase [Burkholderiales bacterium]|nr:ATP-dependent DNA helicase [Burkholderiales bacterium]
MAGAILAAIEAQTVAVLEAGTGTGKTVAYLVPALLAGGKVIISTGTKNLQDQLFHRDIPAVRRALKAPVTAALLKGRANYVCHYHLERTLADGRLSSREDVRHLRRIASSHAATPSGDRAEFAGVPEGAAVWGHVTSTRENCLGQECPHHASCYVLAARRDALAADVVVVNHHLFFADIVLKDEGMAELLPACNTVILDEAHQLPETARMFFGATLASTQLMDLARDALSEGLANAREAADWPDLARALENASRDARLALPENPVRIALGQLARRDALDGALDRLGERLADLGRALEANAARAEGLEAVWHRAQALRTLLDAWRGGAEAHADGLPDAAPAVAPAVAAAPPVRWVEVFGHSFQLHTTPMSIAPLFRAQIEAERRAWILTSATLAVRSDFSLYLGELGLDAVEGARALAWPSPFDYASQALLYVPRDMPDALAPEFTARVVDEAVALIAAANRPGPAGTFLLFTTLRGMNRAHELLADLLPRQGLDLPLLLQGQGSRTELLERFRQLGNAVLVASQSFWEGVDVKGDALKLVVIDKLPFAPPDDPVLAARIEAMKRQGRNAFMEYQLPRAAIALKQGAGRLIRDETDRGVLVICDTRLTDKPYGRRLWQALPPMRRTRERAEALSFLEAAAPDAGASNTIPPHQAKGQA